MRSSPYPPDDRPARPPTDCAPTGTPLMSIVITTRNRPLQLRRALRHVLANSVRAIEVLVVDQSDGDATWREVTEAYGDDARVRYICDAGRGVARGRNLGLEHAAAALIAITDDDCLVPPDWIASLLHAFACHPEVAMLFGTVSAPPHDYRRLVVPVERLDERRIEHGLVGRAARLEGIGAHMALRRALIEDIGGFDPRFGVGGARWSGEDYELHYRALYAGHAVLIEPDITVTHLGMRPIKDAWTLWRRDARGNGAITARLLRTGHWGPALRFWWWNVGSVLANAFFHILFFHYPTGVRLAFWMIGHSLYGLLKEWRDPGEPVTPCARSARGQRAPSSKAAQPSGGSM